MHNRRQLPVLCVTAYAVLTLWVTACTAAELSVTVSSSTGAAVEGAVIIAEPLKTAPRPPAGQKAIMDQHNLQFVPDVLIVQTGTAVDFPNSDQVRHQVYSFSDAKKFERSLYVGKAAAAVIFESAGLVTLGCNIHDNMIGYLWVTDSPWYGRTGADGQLQLHNLAPGEYTLRVWHALVNESEPQIEQHLSVTEKPIDSVSIRLKRPLRPPPTNHGVNKAWEGY